MTTDLDLTNRWLVGASAETIRILNPARVLTPDEALVLAAWLVTLAEPMSDRYFDDVRAAVEAA
jgi:hypothetical protein